MTTVRIHLNHDEGTLWWAEGGDFVGGSDKLHLLVHKIREWAEGECLEIALQLVGDPVTPTTEFHEENTPLLPNGTDLAETTRVSKMLVYA